MSELGEDGEGEEVGPVFAAGDQDYDSAKGWDGRPAGEAERRPELPPIELVPEFLYPRRASEWIEVARESPPAEGLFGPFWHCEELAVLFGGTGTGKSALATQIAESLARGVPIAPFNGPQFARFEPQPVIYLDFELNMTQFAMRYSHIPADNSEFGKPYAFSPNLIRTEMYWGGQIRPGYARFAEVFLDMLTRIIHDNDVKSVIVDNITFLERSSTSNADAALSIMRSLRQLKQVSFVSVLVLAHTPKRRPWMPLTELDLQGSINLANFADSIFALGRCRGSEDLRYLKQIKIRSGRAEHTAANVPVFSLGKYDNAIPMEHPEDGGIENFLGMQFVEFAREDDVLEARPFAHDRKPGRDLVAKARRLAARGKSTRFIADELGIPKSTVHRYVCQL